MANVPNSRGVRCDEQKSSAGQEGVSGSVAEVVGGSRPERNESHSTPKDPQPNVEEGRLSPDFYSDWYFETKDLERTKFVRGILEWRNGGVNRRGESGGGKVVDLRHGLVPETFRVKMLLGKRTKVKVILAISLDAVEIKVDRDSDPGGGVALPNGLDIPLRVDAREIVGCEVVKRKSRDRTVFRIISRSEDGPGDGGNKKNYFQSEGQTAEKIMERLHGVLEVKASSLREEYLETLQKEKEKSGMRRIFGFGCG